MKFFKLIQDSDRAKLTRVILLLLFLVGIGIAGVQLRRLVWEETTHLRFQHDIVNGFYWGSQTLVEAKRFSDPGDNNISTIAFFRGYFALYERVKEQAYEKEYHLDYPPLRLLVMSAWANHVRARFPGVEDGTPEYVEPLLRMNMVCEAITAVAIFSLARRWVIESSELMRSRLLHRISPKNRGLFCGIAAGTAAWLDPSMILDAHGWPQWDVWIIPFYLLAGRAALAGRWFWCGCPLAIGAMLKGQILFVAPFFVLWPLCQGKWRESLCVLAGFLATAAAIVSPWVLRNTITWPFVALAGTVSYALMRRHALPHAAAWSLGVAAIAAFVAGAVLSGSFAWLQIGFLYGSEHYPYLFVSSCYNLPSLLANMGMTLKDPFFSLHAGPLQFALTPQWTLRLLYLLTLVFCAAGAARHAKNRDPRLLIAMATPWLLMFALLGQMHERYLVWGAVMSAVALGTSLRLSLIHFVISIASTAMIFHVMLVDKKLDPTLSTIDVLEHARPYASWVVLGCVAVYFLETLSTSRPSIFKSTPGSPATKMPDTTAA